MWFSAALAVAAGLAAPRAVADCGSRLAPFDARLPFDDGPSQASEPPARRHNPAPGRCPCQGPDCRRLPAEPAPAPTAPTRLAPQEGAALPPAPAHYPGAASNRAGLGRLLTSLFAPSPLEPPPR